MARWTKDYLTGATICAVCAEKVPYGVECCPTAPYTSFAEFKADYFSGDDDVNNATAREFYSDYLLSDCVNLTEYKEQTTNFCL